MACGCTAIPAVLCRTALCSCMLLTTGSSCIRMPHQCAYGPTAATGFSTRPALAHLAFAYPRNAQSVCPSNIPKAAATSSSSDQLPDLSPACCAPLCSVCLSILASCCLLFSRSVLGLGCSGGWWHLPHPTGRGQEHNHSGAVPGAGSVSQQKGATHT